MTAQAWSRAEVEAIVEDYLAMLALEMAGIPYSKAAHRRALLPRLQDRSEQSIEFKHGNISAALLEVGMRPILGYKPRTNFQGLIADVLAVRLASDRQLRQLAEADADAPMAVPEVEDFLSILRAPPQPTRSEMRVAEPRAPLIRLATNYLEREAINRSLGHAGECFILSFERARLLHAGRDTLAGKIEHTSAMRGDGAGYDILSFDENGAERLIEVKTTRYGADTPFFVSRNEVAVSVRSSEAYWIYRLYEFRQNPQLYLLPGSIERSCQLSPSSYRALPR